MRIELIHPMLVHFPIALLSTGTVLRLIALGARPKKSFSFLLPAAWLILALGVLFAWAAVIAGESAANIVAQTLKDLKPLEEHAKHAYRTAVGFTAALSIDFFFSFWAPSLIRKKSWLKKGTYALFTALYLLSFSNLLITGAYGGILVYEEGAAVATSSP